MQEQPPRAGQQPEERHSVETLRAGVQVLEAQVQHTTDTAKVAVQQASEDLLAMLQHLDHTVQELRPTVDTIIAEVHGTMDTIIQDAHGTVQRVLAPAKSMAACLEQMQQNPWTLIGTVVAIAYQQLARPSRSSTPGQAQG
jgi:cell division septum initiation protein DivIVA